MNQVLIRAPGLRTFYFKYGDKERVFHIAKSFPEPMKSSKILFFYKGKRLNNNAKLSEINVNQKTINVSVIYNDIESELPKIEKNETDPFSTPELEKNETICSEEETRKTVNEEEVKTVKEEEENEEEIKENEEEEEVDKEEVIEKLRDNGVDFNEIESNEKLRELLYASPNYCFFLFILAKKKRRKTIEVSNKLINAFLSKELCELFKKIKKIITPPQKIASTRPFTLAKAVHPELNLEEIRNNVKNNMKSLDKIIEGIDICRRNGLFVFPQWTEAEK